MNWINCTCGAGWREWGHLFLRVVTGAVFAYHGYDKVFNMGIEKVSGFFAQAGIPLANIAAPLVAYGELIGGILLILGLLTHWVAKMDIIIILGAIGFVHWANGFSLANGGYEYALLLLAASVYFLMDGGGKYSLDRKFFHRSESAAM